MIEIEEIIKGKVKEDLLHWYSIKLYERDEKVLEKISLNREDKKSIETIKEKSEKEFDDDSESIITNEDVYKRQIYFRSGGIIVHFRIFSVFKLTWYEAVFYFFLKLFRFCNSTFHTFGSVGKYYFCSVRYVYKRQFQE